VSKNVAVFVDVANIFYAAKAAGIDIDYVTLLKAATVGRDFVRAYAYTGLDPENENQRQFHSFLARNGYKVISKDIRKYGDGRIKANLDIELVVDMMKTARNLDIAVVVSGDGDFAPAIRAVQEQGVRVEVISFRGNTSSDLIEVADQFTDIAQIARVDKTSARSGRRVAAEGDLSMTEVPEKETEGAPRRRRGRSRDERVAEIADTPAAAAAAGGLTGNLILLPGERLSRVGDADVGEDELDVLGEAPEGELEAADLGAAGSNGRDAALDDGRRRRRRRGGRGRGRGRQPDELVGSAVGDDAVAGAGAGPDEDEDFEELAPAQPPHQTFGSVWDSQIGVPSASASTPGVGGDLPDDEDLDEPEVPEYLLAERRQRGQGGGQPMGRGRIQRGRGAYQAALDRERYGRGTPQPSFGGGGNVARPDRAPDRQDRGPGRGPDRGRDRGRGGRPQQGRPPINRGPRMDDRPMTSEPRSSEPWSEVPPELEQLLRAELARKVPAPESAGGSSQQTSSAAETAEPAAAAKPARRSRVTKATAAQSTDAGTQPEASTAQPARAATPATRRRTTATKAATTRTATRTPTARTTRTRSTKAATSEGASEPATEEPKKPATRRRRATPDTPAEG
jgi:uncharacterized LabA/DUF88 family protein